MIIYYSATGNTEYIAKELAKQLDDECTDLLERVKTGEYSTFHSEKPFIICAPVYVCEMPRFMSKYLKRQEFTGSREVYFIFTSGGYCGISGPLAKKIFKKKKMSYKGHAEFKMPRNYMVNDHYPMLETKEIEERILNCRDMIGQVVDDIKAGRKLTARHVYLAETIITLPFNPVWCKLKMKAKDFYYTDKCVGCGKCEKLCPLNNIQIVDGKPVWGNNCTHCMACIGNCPTDAIEYGVVSKKKEQYNFGKYKYVIEETKFADK